MQVEYQDKVDQLKQWLQENRQSLTDSGIATIVGRYDGSGDEGSFHSIDVIRENGSTKDFDIPENIRALIEELADHVAPEGYQNNDGGGGEIRLDVESGAISHESWFYTIEQTSEGVEEL